MPRIFISHDTSDRRFVEDALLGLLNALGFDAWFAEDDIETAEHWERSILAGLQASDWFVLVMSPNSASSEWVKDEVAWAIENRAKRFIPVLIEDCDPRQIHIRLPRIQSIDFRGDPTTAREKLIKLLVAEEYKPRMRPPSQSEVLSALMNCASKEILTVVRFEMIDGEPCATLVGTNKRADEFFGMRGNRTITGAEYSELLGLLERWMDRNDFQNFMIDQSAMFEDLDHGLEIYASVPMIINRKHPLRRFHDQKLLPITLAFTTLEEVDGKRVDYILIMYLNLDEALENLQY